jgi:hypothetical protein
MLDAGQVARWFCQGKTALFQHGLFLGLTPWHIFTKTQYLGGPGIFFHTPKTACTAARSRTLVLFLAAAVCINPRISGFVLKG